MFSAIPLPIIPQPSHRHQFFGLREQRRCAAGLREQNGFVALDEQLGTAEGAGERGQGLDGRRQLRQRIAGELVKVHGGELSKNDGWCNAALRKQKKTRSVGDNSTRLCPYGAGMVRLCASLLLLRNVKKTPKLMENSAKSEKTTRCDPSISMGSSGQ